MMDILRLWADFIKGPEKIMKKCLKEEALCFDSILIAALIYGCLNGGLIVLNQMITPATIEQTSFTVFVFVVFLLSVLFVMSMWFFEGLSVYAFIALRKRKFEKNDFRDFLMIFAVPESLLGVLSFLYTPVFMLAAVVFGGDLPFLITVRGFMILFFALTAFYTLKAIQVKFKYSFSRALLHTYPAVFIVVTLSVLFRMI